LSVTPGFTSRCKEVRYPVQQTRHQLITPHPHLPWQRPTPEVRENGVHCSCFCPPGMDSMPV
jgi:hypothetical protein